MKTIKSWFSKVGDRIETILSQYSKIFHKFLRDNDKLIYIFIVTILSLLLRLALFNCIRGDFTNFLKPWYQNIYENGFKILGTTFGDYTPAYYYLLYFISLFKIDPESIQLLWGIKIFSVIADYTLAIYVGLITYFITKNKIKAILSYFLIIFGLTIFLNSSLWGQCDSIYSAFCIISLYYILKEKYNLAMIFFSVAFSFKLQSVFMIPFIILVILKREMKIRYLLWIPLIYSLFALPASFASTNFWQRFIDIWAIYFNQSANSYAQLTLNAGSFYALIFTNFKEENFISSFALILVIAIIGTYIFLIFHSKTKINKVMWVKIFTLLSLVVPYFLPHMHERYFYLADVIVVVYAIVNYQKFYIAILAILNSMIGYMVYLWNVPFINVVPQEQSDPTKALSFRFGAILYLVAIIIITHDIFKEIYPNGLIEENKEKEVNGCEGI